MYFRDLIREKNSPNFRSIPINAKGYKKTLTDGLILPMFDWLVSTCTTIAWPRLFGAQGTRWHASFFFPAGASFLFGPSLSPVVYMFLALIS